MVDGRCSFRENDDYDGALFQSFFFFFDLVALLEAISTCVCASPVLH